MYVRYFLGALALIGGTVFLAANSSILAESAWKYGHSDMSRIAFGASAWVVPWMIAIIPMIVGYTWWRVGWLPLPTVSTLGILVAWVLFFAYNITNGMGAIATSRLETVAEVEKGSSDTLALIAARRRYEADLAAIPAHRTPGAVESLIQAEKTSRRWLVSDSCSEAATTAGRTRDYCKGVRLLEAELASGKEADKLKAQIDELSGKIASAAPVVSSGDPQADLIGSVTGADRKSIQLWLAASTPLILEVGGALMYHLAFWLFGWSIRLRDEDGAKAAPQAKQQEPPTPARKLPSPETARSGSLIPLELIEGMKQGAHAFFRDASRPIQSKDCLTESEWHELYADWIGRRGMGRPLPVESFRRIAAQYVPQIDPVGAQVFYRGRMPYVTEKGEVAAKAPASTFRH